MLFALSILAASALLLWGQPVVAEKCTNPVVRKEWRKLTVPEKADWIRAVNVSKAINAPYYPALIKNTSASHTCHIPTR